VGPGRELRLTLSGCIDVQPDTNQSNVFKSSQSKNFQSSKQQVCTKQASSIPACAGAAPSANQLTHTGLTFEQFVDTMVLCAVSAFGTAPVDTRPLVVFDGDTSLQAKALWTNISEVLTHAARTVPLFSRHSCDET
jgi:hypothetical protein